MEWINSALSDAPQGKAPISSSSSDSFDLPTLVVSQDYPDEDVILRHDFQDSTSDFSPTMHSSSRIKRQSTITLTNTKMTRAQLSHIDLASFNDRFGSISGSMRRGGGGGGIESGLNEGYAGRSGVSGDEFDWKRETLEAEDENVY